MTTELERLTRVEVVLQELREDAGEVKQEMALIRRRLHDLEGIAGMFVDVQKQSRAKEAEQYRRLGTRIQTLSVVVALAAILAPIVTVLLTAK